MAGLDTRNKRQNGVNMTVHMGRMTFPLVPDGSITNADQKNFCWMYIDYSYSPPVPPTGGVVPHLQWEWFEQ